MIAALSPLLILAVTALVALTGIAVRRHAGFTATVASLGFVAAADAAPLAAGPLLLVDGLALFVTGLACLLGLAVGLLAHVQLARDAEPPEEFHVLLLLAVLGAATLAAAAHFAALLLGLELLGVALYGLIAYPASRPGPVEAGVKYLVLAGVASAVLVFGMACAYAGTGSLRVADAAAGGSPLAAAGLALILLGLFFKLALVPLHMWTPDVYVGAPAPVTALIATVSKGSVLAVLWRVMAGADGGAPAAAAILAAAGAASMLLGNVLALRQTNLKRLVAYSSIAHLGYLTLAVLAGGAVGLAALVFYLTAYAVTVTAAFGAVGALAGRGAEAADLDAWRGLLWRRPGPAIVMAVAMLSLAGMPLTAGFLAKVHVLAAGAGAAQWVLVGALVVGSAIGVYYYLRVVLALVEKPDEEAAAAGAASLAPAAGTGLAVLTVLVVLLGVLPAALQPVLEAVAALGA